MTTLDDPFATVTEARKIIKDAKEFGRDYNGRYHMPLLPDEEGTKAGGDWVPYGMKRVTNLAGALADTRALNVWEQSMAMIGLALRHDLYEELTNLVHRAKLDHVDFELLRNYPALRELLAGTPQNAGNSIVGRAKRAAGADAAAQRGTNRHDAWETFGQTGELIGTPAIRQQTLDVQKLLEEAGFRILPQYTERVIRNTEVNAAGRFDNIVERIGTGELIMADLKTKAREFFTWLETDAQLAIYARAQYMLTRDNQRYEAGPALLGVNQEVGMVLHAPSDGGPAKLRKADLIEGWRNARLAVQVEEARAYGKCAERKRYAVWGEDD